MSSIVRNPVVYVDMDGVLVDFVGSALMAHGKSPSEALQIIHQWPRGQWSVAKVLGISEEAFWVPLDNSRFWATCGSTSSMLAIIAAIGEYMPWRILSTPSQHASSAKGKVFWLQRVFGKDFRNYHLSAAPKADLARAGALLIDNSPENHSEFCMAGGECILWPQPWNASTQGKVAATATIREWVADRLVGKLHGNSRRSVARHWKEGYGPLSLCAEYQINERALAIILIECEVFRTVDGAMKQIAIRRNQQTKNGESHGVS